MTKTANIPPLSFAERCRLVFGNMKLWIIISGEEDTEVRFDMGPNPPDGKTPLGYVKPYWDLRFLFTGIITDRHIIGKISNDD